MQYKVTDDPIESKIPSEQIDSREGNTVTPEISDDELLKIVRGDMKRDETKFQTLNQIREKNEKYYTGHQIDSSKINVGEAEAVDNRILVSIETMASIITSVTPEPWLIVTPRGKKALKLQNKLERHLRDEWEYTQKMQQKFERMIRIFFMSRFAVLKVSWDDLQDQICIDVKRPESVRFDLGVSDIDSSPFVGEYVDMSIDEAIDKFGDNEKAKEFLEGERNKRGGRSIITIIEYWGTYGKESFVAYIYKKHVLGKEFNPFWNRNGKNHFKKSKNPYIVMNSLNTNKSLVDDTSLVEQALSLQDLINKRKRQIDANAGMANGILVTSSQYMDKETFDKIQFRPKEKIFLNGEVEDVNNALRLMVGRPLDSGVFEDMRDSIRELDNIFGTHDTTRGEGATSQTARGLQLLKDADTGRLDLTGRSYEQVAEEVYNWMIQMMYVKYKSKRPILTTKEETEPEMIRKTGAGLVSNSNDDEISKEDFKDYKIVCIVKKGTTRPKDPVAMQEAALQLAQVGQMDPLTFHEIFSGQLPPDPRTAARRLFIWNTSPELLFPEMQGADLINGEALEHIVDINNGTPGLDELFESTDIEEYRKHIETHSMYFKGVEIDDDIEPFTSLDDRVQEEHKDHVQAELERIKTLTLLEQQKQENQADIASSMGVVPPEGVSPEGVEPPVPAGNMGTGVLSGGEVGAPNGSPIAPIA